MKNRFCSQLMVSLCCFGFFLFLVFLPDKAKVEENFLHNSDLPPLDVFQKNQNRKMEFLLSELMDVYFSQGREAAQALAANRDIDMERDLVRVVTEAFDPGQIAFGLELYFSEVMNQIRAFGGKVETKSNELIQCLIPCDALENIAALPSVRYLRLPLKPQLLAGNVTSEGVARTSADEWHSLNPYRSGEVKVCVLDLGFKGYQNLLGTELPSSVVTRSFRYDNDISANQVHGTACAEIIHDMMPDAKLYLVNFSTDVEHHNAVNWIINEGVDIISYSVGWTNAGAGDGTGPICDDVKKAAAKGIIWVSAAGNYAHDHWEGTFYDSDADGWHNFSQNDEILDFYVPAYSLVGGFLNWDDWGPWDGSKYRGSNQDYDLYLYYWNGFSWLYVAKSTGVQNGYQWPTEGIGYWYSKVSGYWGLAIRKFSATRNCKLELFTRGNSGAIEYNVPEGSLTIPADSPQAVAVGATDWSNDAYHTYSSRGPTQDGRIKPDFTAPSGVSGVSYGTKNFYGTSASSPHVAGGFALIKGKTPYSLDQVYEILQGRGVDLGPSGKDNQFGYGRLSLKKK